MGERMGEADLGKGARLDVMSLVASSIEPL